MEIIDIQLRGVFARIEEKGYHIELSDVAKDYIAEKGFDKQFGARPLQRALQKYLEDPIADEILEGRTEVGDTLYVDYLEEEEKITVESRKTAALPANTDEEPSADEDKLEEAETPEGSDD